VIFEGNEYTQSVQFEDTVISSVGCDSLYRTVQITVWDNTPEEQETHISECEQVVYDGQGYVADTTLLFTYQNVQGCDSLVHRMVIDVLYGVRDTLHADICEGMHYPFDGQDLTETGVYEAHYPHWNGCDSVSVL